MKEPRLRIALLVKKEEQLLLIEHEKNGDSYWLVPGGGVNFGETLAETIVREAQEELSVDNVQLGRLVLCHDSIAPDESRHVVNLYFEGSLTEKPSIGAESNLKSIQYFGADEIRGLDMRPPVNDLLVAYLEKRLPDNPYQGKLWKE